MDKDSYNHGWRLIETAPKDGTYILLYGNIESDTGIVNDFETDTQPIKAIFEGYHNGNHGWYHVGLYPANPTHWMPLPSPPEKA